METIHNIHQNISSKRIEIRVGLIIAGIATAIICAMALLYEVPSTNNEVVNFIPASNVSPTELIAKTMNKVVVSVWPF